LTLMPSRPRFNPQNSSHMAEGGFAGAINRRTTHGGNPGDRRREYDFATSSLGKHLFDGSLDTKVGALHVEVKHLVPVCYRSFRQSSQTRLLLNWR
jgi:hypothetical protein